MLRSSPLDLRETLVAEIERATKPTTNRRRIESGLAVLDTATGGFSPGELVVIAGRPAMGLSTLARQQALAATRQERADVLIFALDDGPAGYVRSHLRSATGTDRSSSRYGDPAWRERAVAAAVDLPTTRLFVDPGVNLSADEIADRAREWRQQRPAVTPIIIVDSLNAASPVDARRSAGGAATQKLKALAQELEAVVIILIRLGRNVEKRKNTRPRLSDLRRFGDQLVSCADTILLLYRDEYYHLNTPRPGEADLNIAKHTLTPGTVTIRFDSHRLAFVDFPPKRAASRGVTSTQGVAQICDV